MENKNNKKEYNEVLALLELIPSYDYLKIPQKEIDFFKTNSVEEYKVNINSLDDAKISRKAFIIFIKLYKQYIATDEERVKLDEVLSLNDRIRKENYNINIKNKTNQEKKTQNRLIERKKVTIFNKIINKIKQFLKI